MHLEEGSYRFLSTRVGLVTGRRGGPARRASLPSGIILRVRERVSPVGEPSLLYA
jgi:hypothetical protein